MKNSLKHPVWKQAVNRILKDLEGRDEIPIIPYCFQKGISSSPKHIPLLSPMPALALRRPPYAPICITKRHKNTSFTTPFTSFFDSLMSYWKSLMSKRHKRCERMPGQGKRWKKKFHLLQKYATYIMWKCALTMHCWTPFSECWSSFWTTCKDTSLTVGSI